MGTTQEQFQVPLNFDFTPNLFNYPPPSPPLDAVSPPSDLTILYLTVSPAGFLTGIQRHGGALEGGHVCPRGAACAPFEH